MKAASIFSGSNRIIQSALPALAIAAFAFAAPQVALSQAPYVLPYTIQALAGTGTVLAVGATCTGTNGVVGITYDAYGDGCPISSGNVLVGSALDIHDVGVDAQGNIYFIDNLSNGFIRRIDARSGIVTAYIGSSSSAQPTSNCANANGTLAVLDKYGDGCPATDGKANAAPASSSITYNYTTFLAKGRGMSVSKNGDVYFADYNGNVIHKVSLQTGLFSIVAGSVAGGTTAAPKGNIGQKGYTGDLSPANNAEEGNARGVTADALGNVYIADTANNVVRMVFAGGAAATTLITNAYPGTTPVVGYIYTIVGKYPGSNTNATAGSTGDGGPAPAALISAPEDVEIDASGNVYIADFGNNKIRVVYIGGSVAANLIAKTNPGTTAVSGNIYTIMGGGSGVYTPGTGAIPTAVLATSVAVGSPRKAYIDARGNVYLADNTNDVIWFEDASTGFMRPIAGSFGKSSGSTCITTDAFGDNCPAIQATLNPNSAMGVAVDAFGNVLISDSGDKELRRVVTNQEFPAVAVGSSLAQIIDVHFAAADGPALSNPYTYNGAPDFQVTNSACTINADTTQDCLLTVTFTPTKPGASTAEIAVASILNGPLLIGVSGTGNAASVAFDPGATASLSTILKSPFDIAVGFDDSNDVYIADTGNNRVLNYTYFGALTVVAGTGTAGYSGDNAQGSAAKLNAPKSIAIAPNRLLYIADTANNVIRQVNLSTGVITTVAGGGTTVCAAAVDALGDGCPATQATLKSPSGLASDIDGNIFIADTGNNLIRELTIGGYLTYVAGATTVCGLTGTDTTFGNGCPANGAIFNAPTGLAIDPQRNLYIADTGTNEVRKLNSAGIVSLISGTGVAGASGNGGPAAGAQLNAPTGVAIDAATNVYIADTGNAVIRIVNSAGIISSVAGTLSAPGTGTLPGSAFAVQLSNPTSVAATGQGFLYVLDSGNNRAFTINRGSVTNSFGRTLLNSSSPTLQIQETDTGNLPAALPSPLFATSGASGQFTLTASGSSGCTASLSLAPGASCLLSAQFNPTTLGLQSATYTETGINTINSPVPFITLSGTGAVLTITTSSTVVTTPATGSPQYSVPFVVTTTVTPASCNLTAPACIPAGSVTFFVNGTQVGLPVPLSATGTASQTISGLNVGTAQVTAVYASDGFYASSTSPALIVTIAKAATVTKVTANPAAGPQFAPITLTSNTTTPVAGVFPTGTVTFYVAGNPTPLGSASVTSTTGVASISDVFVAASGSTPVHNPNSFGLPAGTYQLTAVYSGDPNYAPSTSAVFSLTIAADAPSFTTILQPSVTGTAQGSTAQSLITITPSNTLNGTVTFACTGMPTDSVCTFSPTTLTFTPVAGVPTAQQTQVTLFTDVPPGVLPTAARNLNPRLHSSRGAELAAMLGWPVLLFSFLGLTAFRRRLRHVRLLTVLALCGILSGGSMVLSGCTSYNPAVGLTPVGTYNVTLTATGPSGTSTVSTITFTVTKGITGQL